MKCPNNEGYVWNWFYADMTINSYVATNDVYIKCANEDDFCTSENLCGKNEGDCDIHDECQDGLVCGSNNCPDSLGFHSEFDCCYAPAIGDEAFCTSEIPCGEDEGDCDSHTECQAGLACGLDNCPTSLGFDSEVDCCYYSIKACCPTLNVMLTNDVKNHQGSFEGVYTFHGYSNEVEYWVDAGGQNAIWYKASGSTCYWLIGYLHDLGTMSTGIFSQSNTLEKKCPNNEGYVWNWNFWNDNFWITTNDVDIKCKNENDFCTSENPCGSDKGDCDTHDDCQDGLFCGSNNCPNDLGFHSEFDCCYAPTVGDEHFCTFGIPCGENEGDCDTNDECQDDLECGSNNCPGSLGFNSDVDCCYPCSSPCGFPNYKGDSYCDDENNNCGCEWDGGDCCGENVNTQWCSACQCLDPNAQNSRKQTIDETVSDYRNMKNPRKINISKHRTYNKERRLGLRPQQFEIERKMSPNPDVRKHTMYTNVDTRRFEDVKYPKRMLTRHKIDATIKRYTETSQFGKHLSLQHPRHSTKEDRMSRLRSQDFAGKNEIPPNFHFRNDLIHHNAISNHPIYFDSVEDMLLNPEIRKKFKKRSRRNRNIIQHKTNIEKTNSSQLTKLKSVCEGKEGTSYQDSSIVCNHLASSVEGLRVKLNPNVEEYKTDAAKNNFIGFKYLVHSPYDFPFVEEVGKTMGPSIQSHIGFLGFHSWITDGADAYNCNPFQCPKNCASKRDINLDVFKDYTRANCVFECQARSIFKNCGCLPYHYPEFHLVNTGIWKNVTSTACNHTQLICLSRVKGI